ncbi:uncharacterized protein C12orf71 homolog [Marmota marmota marmota]|uniref:uncharacterized protein C12orf71 homolog n=1 Tax=Marmota marmota marmota TaxID=9994 RepID=UPI000762A1D5|nr:uncharacterized protein C12orf71 homolog [Marmota marmota marmota]
MPQELAASLSFRQSQEPGVTESANIDCEDIIPCEELTSQGPSCHFLPPVQGAWGTESVKRPTERQNPIQDNPEKPGEEAILEVLDAYLDWHHEDLGANGALNEDSQRMDKCPQERINQTLWDLDELMKDLKVFLESQKDDKDDDPVLSDSPQEEDLQPCSSASPYMDQVSHQEPEACEDLPKCDPPENGDMDQILEMPPELEDDEIVEMQSQDSGTEETSSVLSEESKEEDVPLDTKTTCFLNFVFSFQWLRKRLVSFMPGRKSPGRVNNGPLKLALQRRHLFGGNRILPQESL